MSYQEKRVSLSIFIGISILVGYFLYTRSKVQNELVLEGDLKFWATSILIFIGIGVVAMIVGQIIFHILLSIGMAIQEQLEKGKVDEQLIGKSIKAEMVTDERDRLIELKSLRVASVSASIGMMIGLVVLVLNNSPVLMLNILFVSFCFGTILEGCMQLYLYRKG